MASNKTTIQKTAAKDDLAIAANLRTSNLCHDAEIEMIIALGEALGLKMQFNKKTGEISIIKEQVSTPHRSPEPPQQQKQQTIYPCIDAPRGVSLDEAERFEAYKDAVKELIKDTPIQVTTHCDSSVHLANNEAIMILVEQRWDEWFRKIESDLEPFAATSGRKHVLGDKVVQFGSDVCYRVNESDEHHGAPDTKEKKPSRLKRLMNCLYEDIISSWWKFGSYTLCIFFICCCASLWYKNHRMESIVKEYGIIKPVLMCHPYYRQFIQSLDSTLTMTDIDEVIECVQKNQRK